MRVAHLVLTRFNCRFGATWTSAALDPKWLSPRFALFERYCLPSVLQQTRQAFQWMIFFDEETPEPFKVKAAELKGDRVSPIFVRLLTAQLIRQTIREHLPHEATHVITSRLDNDDGLAIDYVERIQNAFRPAPHREYLNVSEGIILHRGRAYRRRDPHNAFVSLVEPTDAEIQGVWTYPHTEIRQHAPVRQVGGGPGWLQVIHEANVSNKVRGRRIHPREVGPNFVLDRDELLEPGRTEYFWERNVMHAAWSARDTLAAAGRAGKRLIGKGWKPS